MNETRENVPEFAKNSDSSSTGHVWALSALLALFCFRVGAQLVQAVDAVPFLPPFWDWQGSALSYPLLLGAQFAIITGFALIIRLVARGGLAPRCWQVHGCLLFGAAYFGVMAVRLAAGMTVLAQNPWFAKPLPALFHLVLASFVLVFGHYLWTQWQRRRTENRS